MLNTRSIYLSQLSSLFLFGSRVYNKNPKETADYDFVGISQNDNISWTSYNLNFLVSRGWALPSPLFTTSDIKSAVEMCPNGTFQIWLFSSAAFSVNCSLCSPITF